MADPSICKPKPPSLGKKIQSAVGVRLQVLSGNIAIAPRFRHGIHGVCRPMRGPSRQRHRRRQLRRRQPTWDGRFLLSHGVQGRHDSWRPDNRHKSDIFLNRQKPPSHHPGSTATAGSSARQISSHLSTLGLKREHDGHGRRFMLLSATPAPRIRPRRSTATLWSLAYGNGKKIRGIPLLNSSGRRCGLIFEVFFKIILFVYGYHQRRRGTCTRGACRPSPNADDNKITRAEAARAGSSWRSHRDSRIRKTLSPPHFIPSMEPASALQGRAAPLTPPITPFLPRFTVAGSQPPNAVVPVFSGTLLPLRMRVPGSKAWLTKS